jgi:hypothetical protein
MSLTLRPTGLASPAYADQLELHCLRGRQPIGRMYEDKQAQPELRWFTAC